MTYIGVIILICCLFAFICWVVEKILEDQKIKSFYKKHNNCVGAIIPGRWEAHFRSPLCFCAKIALSKDMYDWAKYAIGENKPSDEQLCNLFNQHGLIEGKKRADFIVLPSLPDNTIEIIN